MTLKLIAAACALSLCLSTAVRAEGTAQAGQAKSATCVACHGVDGNSVNPEWPKLAGQHPEYIAKQLQAFKSGARKNPLMSPMAAPLSDQDMEDLAAYFSAQATKGGETEPSKVSTGQRIYRGGNAASQTPACLACHGPNGRGNPPALYPSIRGQYATYVAAQLRAYKSGARATDQNQMMRNVAASLPDEQIDAVASYVQGLR
jgi:cytochrome c553